MKKMSVLSATALCAGLIAQSVSAQAWTSAYTSPTATGDCAGLPAALNTGFTLTPWISQAKQGSVTPYRIIKLTFWQQPTAQVSDIYMAEKGVSGSARVLYFNGMDSTLKVIGTLTGISHGGGGVDEQGLLGIAVNPVSFNTDNFLYVFYAIGTEANASPTNGWRVSRFTLNATTKMMDMASEKILMHIPAGNSARWHTAGSLQFDNYGNLYIATGDNEALAMGPGNTADLRGGILRIKPDNSAKGYSIPAGNFGAYWSTRFTAQGRTALAATYADTAIVKPEIYVKGSRNPYAFSTDKYRLGWIQWSECGPDAQRGEEHNFTTTPAFSGWPFWAANAVRQTAFAGSYNEPNEPSGTAWATFNPAEQDTNRPVNNWAPATGADTLPPMHRPYYTYTQGCASGGPILRYNGATSKPGAMPPHLDNVVMSATFTSTTNNVFAIKIDTAAKTTTGTATTVFTMARGTRPSLGNSVDFQQGPDGALYFVDWGGGCCSSSPTAANAGVSRITYDGTCKDPGLVPGPTSIQSQKLVRGANVEWLKLGSTMFSVFTQGPHEAAILDVAGRTLHTFRGEGPMNYNVPALGAGVHVLRVKTIEGIVSRPLAAQ